MKLKIKKYKREKRKDAPRPVLHILTYDPRIFCDGTCQDEKQYKEAELTTGLEVEEC